jgi:hypothetical protein
VQPELHVQPSPVCDNCDHKAVDCSKLCPLCVNTVDCNHIVAGPQWKGHPDYSITEEDFLILMTYPLLITLILLSCFLKVSILQRRKRYEKEKVRAKICAEGITKELNLIRADKAHINSVACIPTRDPREIIVFDEEWFKRTCNPKEGYPKWKF